MFQFLKKTLLKPAVIRFAQGASSQRFSHRLAYLGRFHRWGDDHPCPTFEHRRQLWQHVFDSESLNDEITYLEFGVYRGESIRWWVEQNSHPNSRFVGFDSFEGLPEDWGHNYKPRGTFTTEGVIPDIPDVRCEFVAGWFQNVVANYLSTHPPHGRLVLHLDADLYSSTLYVLATLHPFLKAGDVLIFDEFHDYLDEYRAWEDFQASFLTQARVIGSTKGHSRVALRVESK